MWRAAIAEFGEAYRKYASEVPGFIPRISRSFGQTTGSYRAG